jgi:hypothetical protein
MQVKPDINSVRVIHTEVSCNGLPMDGSLPNTPCYLHSNHLHERMGLRAGCSHKVSALQLHLWWTLTSGMPL